LGVGRASVGNAGVSREAISHKPLAISPERGELVISVGKQRGEEVVIVGDWFVEAVRARLAIAAEHEVAEMREEASFGRREEAIGYGDGEFCEDAADFTRGNQGAARGDEFAGEIGGAESAVRCVGMGVAKAVALRMSGKGAAASIGESKLASVVRGWVCRSHAGRIIYCVYSCLVTERYMQFRTAEGSVRMGADFTTEDTEEEGGSALAI